VIVVEESVPLSGELDLELATEELFDDPESGNSVKPNSLGRLPRFCVI
jgi:hypothetical protein